MDPMQPPTSDEEWHHGLPEFFRDQDGTWYQRTSQGTVEVPMDHVPDNFLQAEADRDTSKADDPHRFEAELDDLKTRSKRTRLMTMVWALSVGLVILALAIAFTLVGDDEPGDGVAATEPGAEPSDGGSDGILAVTDCSWFTGGTFGHADAVQESFRLPGEHALVPEAAVLTCSIRVEDGGASANFPDVVSVGVHSFESATAAVAGFDALAASARSFWQMSSDECADPIAGVECTATILVDSATELVTQSSQSACLAAGTPVAGAPHVRNGTVSPPTRFSRVVLSGSFVVTANGALGGEGCVSSDLDPAAWLEDITQETLDFLADALAD